MPRVEKPAVTQEEKDAVKAHVNKYVESLLKPDIETMKTCFFDKGTIFVNTGDAVVGGHIQALYDIMERDGGLPKLEWTINVLAVTGNTAVAQVLLYQDEPIYEVTDLLSLMKLPDGNWTIVNKVPEMYQYFKQV
ncbi:hypothetical protein Poli38472_010074 [Pythium oligandrum]|uniref:Nuclear transport factor 2 family protein n=1 Tax=Pythium oligandrum TaxID=41045 RepID=A0A8K1FCN8_PYTOL|nr:hypothetical protein Poli38472_010074 [Pythium oligandrum]|eukprot:TMW58515.1 hypothetical protein Poli38472_010074 [Pythium oligandrum]